jgi:hypothetical protein
MDLLERFSLPNRRRLEFGVGIISLGFPLFNIINTVPYPITLGYNPAYWGQLALYLLVILILVLFTWIQWDKSMMHFLVSDLFKYALLVQIMDFLFNSTVRGIIADILYLLGRL